jgi:type VI secretion system Hcp family effector
MSNAIFLELETDKGGKITDSTQTKKGFKDQLLVQAFDLKAAMALSHNKSTAQSMARPEPIKATIQLNGNFCELLQANLTGDRIKACTFSFPVTNKMGIPETLLTVDATGGIISSCRLLTLPFWEKENDSAPELVEIEISYEKIEVKGPIDKKQMTYQWDEH